MLGTIAFATALGAGSYFLAIAPVLDETSQARTQAESVEQANDLQRTKIARLKTQFAELDTYKAELAALQVQIPTEADLSGYFRQLQDIATARQVTLLGLATQSGQAVVPVAAVPGTASATVEPPEPAEPSEPDTSPDAPASPAPAEPEAPTAPAGFVAIPVAITALGTYEDVVAFLADAQAATPRLMLVIDFVGTAQPAADASAGRPATVVGDLELTVNGYLYVLQDPAAPAPVEPAEPLPLPAPVPGKNPLIPVVGTEAAVED
ncbi:hypothetical protein N866_10845 [Actinotalea ferrariae CF5-4]|uniref:Pilus assembly protein PilO n=1 Tax=Actinotalea ferrariae CF5-4 TaxID=948458 RepID=A0A021VTJ7_9CELL|nr:hypothetical protein N866_10845 [Actinotalea ferrariae CF5-4]